jgi:hypothetical protein
MNLTIPRVPGRFFDAALNASRARSTVANGPSVLPGLALADVPDHASFPSIETWKMSVGASAPPAVTQHNPRKAREMMI